MAAYRCIGCGINWPMFSGFQPCAACRKKALTDLHAEPLDPDDAARLRNLWRFEWYWRDWDLKQFRRQLDAL